SEKKGENALLARAAIVACDLRSAERRADPCGLRTMPKIKRILVPVDFSEPSLAALRFAIDLARTLKARLEIVHAVEPVMYAPMIGSAVDLDRFREQQGIAAQRRLAGLAADLRRRRVRCRTVLRMGAAPSTIVDLAKRSAIDLIVIATEGRHGVGRLLLGSVAE